MTESAADLKDRVRELLDEAGIEHEIGPTYMPVPNGFVVVARDATGEHESYIAWEREDDAVRCVHRLRADSPSSWIFSVQPLLRLENPAPWLADDWDDQCATPQPLRSTSPKTC